MAFDDLLQDLDDKYKGMGDYVGGGTFLKEADLVKGFEGTYKGYTRKESQFGPTTWWKFEIESGEEVVLNRPHYREVEDKETGAKMKKPTRFLVAFIGAKIVEGDQVEIKQKGKGYKIEYQITKSVS